MAFELDHTESLKQTWVWRKAPLLLASLGVVLLLGGELYDWFWAWSLRPARCTLLSTEVTGEIAVSGRSRRLRTQKGHWVPLTNVTYLLNGVEPRRRAVLNGVGYEVGQVRDCWTRGRTVYFHVEVDKLQSRVSAALNCGIMIIVGLVWHLKRQKAATVTTT